MTRDQFIDYWLSNIGQHRRGARREDGVVLDWAGEQARWFALRCGCNDENCQGWAMVPENLVEHHMRVYAPKDAAQ